VPSLGRTLATLVALAGAVSVALQYGFEISPEAFAQLEIVDHVIAILLVLDLVVVAIRSRHPVRAFSARRFEWLLTVTLATSYFSAPDLEREVLHLYLVASAVIRGLRFQERMLGTWLRPVTLLPVSYAALIVVGTVLLCLPRSSADPTHPLTVLDALFMSTSAACVTGLTVRDLGIDFSLLGQGVMLVLMQVGGLGIITFVATMSVFSGRSLSIPQLRAVSELVMNRGTLGSIRRQVGLVALWAFTIEGIGAVVLYHSWPMEGATFNHGFASVLHAVSAFCNAGLALSSDSMESIRTLPIPVLTMTTLIVLGGIGFPVIIEVASRLGSTSARRRLATHTQLALVTSLSLLVAGTAGFWLLESRAALFGESFSTQTTTSLLESATARTAGFTTLPIDTLQPATRILLIVLMAIGAGPVSTGGGIKTVTFAVLLLTVRTMMLGRERVEVFGRTLAWRAVRAAISVFVLYVLSAMAITFLLTLFDPGVPVDDLAFEAVSALSTVGLSTGYTAALSAASKLVLCVAMFVGRVGPLALVVVMLGRQPRTSRYEYPEEDVIVG